MLLVLVVVVVGLAELVSGCCCRRDGASRSKRRLEDRIVPYLLPTVVLCPRDRSKHDGG